MLIGTGVASVVDIIYIRNVFDILIPVHLLICPYFLVMLIISVAYFCRRRQQLSSACQFQASHSDWGDEKCS